MIILKILLFILLAVIGLILLILVIPLGGEVSFIGGKLKFKVNLWILNVMDSDGGGILGWLKRLKSRKKSGKSSKPKKPEKTKKPKKQKNSDNHDIPYKPAKTESDTITETVSLSDSVPENPDVTDGTSVTDSESDISNDVKDDLVDYDLDDTDDTDEEDSGHKKKKKDKNKNKDDDDEDNDEKKSLSDKLEMLLDIWGNAKNPLCVIFKAFKFSDLYIDFVVANEDAHKCALNYGKFSALTYRGLAIMSRVFTVRLKTVDIQPGFGMKKGRFDAAVKLRLRVGTIVIAGLWFLITYIFRVFIPGKLKGRKAKKSAAAQK